MFCGQIAIMDKMTGKHLIAAALEAVRPLGLYGTVLAEDAETETGRADAMVRLKFGGIAVDYVVEAKRHLRAGILGQALHQLARFQGNKLLITDHITPPMADELRKRGVEFIDTAGNAYLNQPPLLVWINGQRPREQLWPKEQVGRAFQTTGLQVLFTLLCKPDAVNLPYREIAALAGVAHGTVGWVMPELIKLGFMIEINKKRRLVDGERLLKQWVDAYIRKLRPKLVLGRYAADALDWAATIDAEKYGLLLGGEPAAYRMTKHLRPGKATFYGDKVNPKLLIDQRLRPDPNGNVEILKRFWKFEETAPGMVPPVLIYADLLATGDARCLEAAEIMYDAIADRLK
jgi:hypothetical protein